MTENVDINDVLSSNDAVTVENDLQTNLTVVPNEESVTSVENPEEDQEMEAVEELPDYSHLNKAGLLNAAQKAFTEKESAEAMRILKTIRPLLESILQEEQNAAMDKFIEEGGEKENFEWKDADQSRESLNQLFNDLRNKIQAQKLALEAEKAKNLKDKERILSDIKNLVESEQTADTHNKLKELQSEWKQIKHVPKEHAERIYESYRVLVERFYDNYKINIELIQLDREKNLDQKIELTKKVTDLHEEKSIKAALIAVKKYVEEWKNIGPVPKDVNEDIWNRFKAEVDKVFSRIKSESERIETMRKANLEGKQNLIVQATALANFSSTRIKEWLEKTKEVNALLDEWKKIGMVPLSHRDQVWESFRNARNSFFVNKNLFFKALNTERNSNLKGKTELCEKAEAIAANPIDWAKQTEEIKRLQEEWKKLGSVGEKLNDSIWKRFRTACDLFFTKKTERFASQIEEQKANLTSKNTLIEKLDALVKSEENSNVFNELKAIQDEWNKIGFVPKANKAEIDKKYSSLLDVLYARHRQLSRDMRNEKERQQIEAISNAPDAKQRIQREEKIVMERIRGLKNDIDTWENNMGFFKNASAKSFMTEQMQDKIEIARKHITQLEEKLKMIRSYKNKEN